MNHSFDVDVAKEYGIQPAIILNHLYFWILKNRANNTNFYDDNYWTYNSKKAFSELFPYMTERQIDYAIKKLIDNGLVITGNYNKVAYDRTLWYAITKKGYSIIQNCQTILQNCEMETTKLSNGNNEIVEPIPDINTNIKHKYKTTDINTNNNIVVANANDKVTKTELEQEFEEIWLLYPNKKGKSNALKSYIKARKKGTTKDEVLQGIQNYNNYIKFEKVDPQYIKHGSTWFNQECWNDDYTIKRELTTQDLTNVGAFTFDKFKNIRKRGNYVY